MNPLKACPFCGNNDRDRLENTMIAGRSVWAIKCGVCGAQGPVCDGEKSTRVWNERREAG